MKCPRCKRALIGIECEAIEVDYCPDCGLWLDSFEIDALMETVSHSTEGPP
jgi:Zn-finger nucleic acid-binding protein